MKMNCLLFPGLAKRLQRLLGIKKSDDATDEKRSSLQISAPFNFKRESVTLPGLSDDELLSLKEKAVASVRYSSPRKAPTVPKIPEQTTIPAVNVIPSTPTRGKKNDV